MNEAIRFDKFAKDQLRMDPSRALRMVKKLEQETGQRFLHEGRSDKGQRVKLVTREAADAVLELRRQKGFVPGSNVSAIEVKGGEPTVYVLGLHGGRIKIGYTDAFDQRMRDHRTLAPDLEVLRRWQFSEAVEKVMQAIAGRVQGVTQVGVEVFQTDNADVLAAVLDRLDSLAAMM